jgi:hypothetical protein
VTAPLTILPFSGGRERERSDRRGRPSATPGWAAAALSAVEHAFDRVLCNMSQLLLGWIQGRALKRPHAIQRVP